MRSNPDQAAEDRDAAVAAVLAEFPPKQPMYGLIVRYTHNS
jgi:hypothetical protein